jgi:hypothetical protein
MHPKIPNNQIEFVVNLMKQGKTREVCRQAFLKKFKRDISYEKMRQWARNNNIKSDNNGHYNKNQSDFIIAKIKQGLSHQNITLAFRQEFNRLVSCNTIRRYSNSIGFKSDWKDRNGYTNEELSILKGTLLMGSIAKESLKSIKNRTLQAVKTKLRHLRASGAVGEVVKKKIENDVKRGVSVKDISKKYSIDRNSVTKFAENINKTTVKFKNLKRWAKIDVDSLFDIVIEKQKKLRSMDSEQQSADIQIKTKAKYIALTVFSDFHLENINTDLEQLRQDFKIVKDTPNFFSGFNGDLIDNFAAGPHKEGVIESALPPREARMLAGRLFDSLKDKMLWMVLGCHDAWDKDNADYDLPQHIARKIMVPYLGAGGDINLKINNISYDIHSRHKYRGSSGMVNGTGCCKKILTEIDPKFDIVAVSHNHFSEIKTEFYLGKQRAYIRTGSYKREDRYSKRLGFRANDFNIQIPVIILNTEKKEMKIVNGINNASEMLKALNKSKK